MYCPDCNTPLLSGANKCTCGWSRKSKTETRKPTIDHLIGELTGFLNTVPTEKYPVQLPTNTADAAKTFIAKFIRPYDKEFESVTEVPAKKSGDQVRWVWPYAFRCKHLLAKFCYSDARMRSLIKAGAEDEIFWGGEEYDHYLSLISEFERMRDVGFSKYREDSMASIKLAISRMSA